MKLEIEISEQQYNNIMELQSANIGRVPYKGIIMYAVNAIKRGKTLEQEPILDKIRAEIVDLGQRTMNDNRASGIWACRDIIDKYKADSEDKE